MLLARFSRRESRAGRALAWLMVGCLVVVLVASSARRVLAGRPRAPERAPGSTQEDAVSLQAAATAPETGPERREVLVAGIAPPPAPARLTGRLQVNGYAARRGRVRLRTESGDFERELAIDEGGRFYCESVPAGRIVAGFEADGLFERDLLLPDHLALDVTPGELEVLDLDWWTRQVNVVVHSEDGWSGPARIQVHGPGYDTEVQANEAGNLRLDVVGEGTFTFRATTPAGLVAETELEFEAGDELDTAVLLARIKEY